MDDETRKKQLKPSERAGHLYARQSLWSVAYFYEILNTSKWAEEF